jgi:ABC-type protease/lipase transport system fused ATPase/permease subunit
MTSTELDESAVEREPVAAAGSDGGIAVQVKDGVFTWDDQVDEAGQEVLRGINVEVRTGAMAAVVGMVGSGKSSLLGCVLGEMRKISGKVLLDLLPNNLITSSRHLFFLQKYIHRSRAYQPGRHIYDRLHLHTRLA